MSNILTYFTVGLPFSFRAVSVAISKLLQTSSGIRLKKIAHSNRNVMRRKRQTECDISKKNITHLLPKVVCRTVLPSSGACNITFASYSVVLK